MVKRVFIITARHCYPCQQAKPVLSELEKLLRQHKDIEIIKLQLDYPDSERAQKYLYHILENCSIWFPTIIIEESGNTQGQMTKKPVRILNGFLDDKKLTYQSQVDISNVDELYNWVLTDQIHIPSYWQRLKDKMINLYLYCR